MLYHRPVGRPDQCLLHQRFGLDLFIPQIDLSCFASGHLYNTCVVVCFSQGGPLQGSNVLYKLIAEKWAAKGAILQFSADVTSGLLTAGSTFSPPACWAWLSYSIGYVSLLRLGLLWPVLMRILYSDSKNGVEFAQLCNCHTDTTVPAENALGNMKVVITYTIQSPPVSWG